MEEQEYEVERILRQRMRRAWSQPFHRTRAVLLWLADKPSDTTHAHVLVGRRGGRIFSQVASLASRR